MTTKQPWLFIGLDEVTRRRQGKTCPTHELIHEHPPEPDQRLEAMVSERTLDGVRAVLKLTRYHANVEGRAEFVEFYTAWVETGVFDGDTEFLVSKQWGAWTVGGLMQAERRAMDWLQRVHMAVVAASKLYRESMPCQSQDSTSTNPSPGCRPAATPTPSDASEGGSTVS